MFLLDLKLKVCTDYKGKITPYNIEQCNPVYKEVKGGKLI
jgi:hypothetical protein